MTTETDPRLRLIREHFEMMRQLSVDEAQAAADAAAARGDEWSRKLHQDHADWSREYKFNWVDQQDDAASA